MKCRRIVKRADQALVSRVLTDSRMEQTEQMARTEFLPMLEVFSCREMVLMALMVKMVPEVAEAEAEAHLAS